VLFINPYFIHEVTLRTTKSHELYDHKDLEIGQGRHCVSPSLCLPIPPGWPLVTNH